MKNIWEKSIDNKNEVFKITLNELKSLNPTQDRQLAEVIYSLVKIDKPGYFSRKSLIDYMSSKSSHEADNRKIVEKTIDLFLLKGYLKENEQMFLIPNIELINK